MKKAMNTTTNNTTTITVVATGLTHPHTFEKLDNAIHYAELAKREFPNCEDVTILVNNILMPSTEDETFFYASVEAAASGKVWLEEVHRFVTPEFKCQFEADCFDWEDENYEEYVLDAIEDDVEEYNPVTREAGDYSAIVRDKDVADICHKAGYRITPQGDGSILEDGSENTWWIVSRNDGYYYDGDDEYENCISECATSDRFVEYEETGEIAFIGNHLRGYWNPWDSVAHFHLLDDAGHLVESSVGVELTQDVWRGICGNIEDNPDTYGISVETDYAGNGEYGMLIHHLETMPFDRYTDSDGFIHRTGWEYLETNGDWVLEEESDTNHVIRVKMFGR